MESYLFYIGKAAVAASAFFLAYLVLFQNRKQFVFNRIYLPVSLALSFVIPLITFTTVQYIDPVATVSNGYSFLPETIQPVETPLPPFKAEWYHYLFGLYILGTAVFLFHLLLGHYKAIRIIKKSRTQQLFNTPINITEKDVHPFSFFSKIVISENTLFNPHLEIIIAHEKIHVKEKHTLDILFTEILFLLQWFNPFAWLLKNAVRNNIEYKTDHEIAKNTDAQTYQMAMVELAGKEGVAPFLTALNGSQLKNRIIMMKKKTKNRFALVKQLVALPLLAVLVMGLANREIKTEINYQNESTTAHSEFQNKTTASEQANKEKNTPAENIIVSNNERQTESIPGAKDNYTIQADTEETMILSENRYRRHEPDTSITKKTDISFKLDNRLFIIDGREYQGDIKDFNTNDIKRIDVLKAPTATRFYGEKGKNGVVMIETKTEKNSGAETNLEDILAPSTSSLKIESLNGAAGEPLYIVDGKEAKHIETIPPEEILKVDVLKGKSATDLYGKKGKNGVVLIFTKTGNYSWNKTRMKRQNEAPSKVEEMPEFPGGESALNKFIADNIEYPFAAREKGIQGKVFVKFIITKTSNVTDVKIARGVDPALNEEAMRVVSLLSGWKPGKQNGEPVDVSYTVPVNFVLKNYPVRVKNVVSSLPVPNPVYIIDGKEVENMDGIHHNNIEKIDILKGKSATDLYGEKGKNGVVLIITKSGNNPDQVGTTKTNHKLNKFLISIELQKNHLILEGLEGCTFTNLKFSINDHKPVAINQFGMASAGTGNSTNDSGFLFKIEKINDQIKLTGKTGTAWKELSYKPLTKKHLISETGVSKANNPLIVVDGMVTGYKSLDLINPGDIQSINVLKDEQATERYGKKGENGVIEVTMKPVGIYTEIQLRRFIAKEIRYPVLANKSNLEETVNLSVKIDTEGKISVLTDEPLATDFTLGEIVVVGYKINKTVSTGYESKNAVEEAQKIEEQLFTDETKRVIHKIPKLDIAKFKGKTVGITVKFILQ